jgi:hypothetical protein
MNGSKKAEFAASSSCWDLKRERGSVLNIKTVIFGANLKSAGARLHTE